MDTKNLQSATWVVVTLIYLYGDVLRICSGDFAKSMASMNFNQFVWLGIAILMLIPILMVFFTLVLPQSVAAGRISLLPPSSSSSIWLACPPILRYMTNFCWRSAWDSMGSLSGMRGIGVEPYN